jgi:hypothetical protein
VWYTQSVCDAIHPDSSFALSFHYGEGERETIKRDLPFFATISCPARIP